MGNTRQAYYKAEKRQELQEKKNQIVLKKIRKIREELSGVGTRKLHHLTISYRKRHGIKMGRDKMYDLLRRKNMLTVAAPSLSAKDAPVPLTLIIAMSDIKTSQRIWK